MKLACVMLGLLLSVWGLVPVFAQSAAVTTQTTEPQAAPPVVLELFTSQGCSFCPPADALMGQMAEQQDIIGLSCHVDYFNVKKNSLGRDFCTRRQVEYNRYIGTGPRYTPQLVINGRFDVIGYETGKVNAAILKARGDDIGRVNIVQTGGDTYNYSLPAIAFGPPDAVKLWLAVFNQPQTISVTEGANFGKKFTYYNVVDQMQDLGGWTGDAMTGSVKVPFAAQNAGFAVVAQNTRTGHVVAAGLVKR